MTVAKDELLRLIEGLPEEEVERLVSALREHSLTHDKYGEQIGAEETGSIKIIGWDFSNVSGSERLSGRKLMLRWPRLGPGAVGAAILGGWAAGIVAGPLVAIIGAFVGLVLGDRLDQHTTAAADA